MKTKGIILAGGSGTRLYPLTSVFSKQLQAVYDKPMIYYPLAVLMLAEIRDVLLISTPRDLPYFKLALGDGSRWGINISYVEQKKPGGIAEAFVYGESFIGDDQVCLILGDNIFYGKLDFLRSAIKENEGGTIFGYWVSSPQDYGVVELDGEGKILSIEEKPKKPKSNLAIPGLYIFDSEAPEIAKNLRPSARGELEITDVQKEYLKKGKLKVKEIGRGVAWLDTGSPENLTEASYFIAAIEKRQGRKIACLEEIALYKGYATLEDMEKTIDLMPNSQYKRYCARVLEEFKNA